MTISKISRRDFLSLTGKASGGLALGASSLTVSLPAVANAPFPIAPETPKDALAMNIFIQIDSDNAVYIVAHRSEMGQGSRTGLPQVVADELEADWDKVKVVQARGDAAYGSQNTDGSRSVRDFYSVMREMGATAKLMLRKAAATKWNIPLEQCEAENHKIIRKGTKASFTYGELAEAAAKIPKPKTAELTFKSTKDFRYIKKPVEIVDLEKILVGDTVYGMDVDLPNMVYASIEQCPYLDGGVTSFDASEAKKVPGVIDVVEIKARPMPAVFHPLPGIAVVASNTWAAFEGRKKLKIQWKKSSHQNHNSAEYMAEIKDSIKNGKANIVRKKGDIDKAFAAANKEFEALYTVPYLVHAPMEPMAAAAIATKDKIEVWASTQTPQSAQKNLMERFGLKDDQVKVNVTLLGGGFGRKSKPDFILAAADVSMALNGRPMRLMWSREDDIRQGYYHAISAVRLKAAMDKKKDITAFHARACYPSIGSLWNIKGDNPSNSELDLGLTNTPFNVANEQVDTTPVFAHTRIGWMRSVCNIQQAFALGSFVDELAKETGNDTVDMWMQMIGSDRNMDYASHGYKLSNYSKSMDEYPFETQRLKNTLKLVAKKSGWGKKTPKNEGWGISCHYSFLTHVAIATHVTLKDGKLTVDEVHCAVDCGLAVNPDRVKSQMEGAVIFGLSAALIGEITFADGKVEQSNFHDYPVLRMSQSPEIHIHLIDRNDTPRGVGEPGVPPVAPSLTNAIVAAGGKRIRDLPVNKVYNV